MRTGVVSKMLPHVRTAGFSRMVSFGIFSRSPGCPNTPNFGWRRRLQACDEIATNTLTYALHRSSLRVDRRCNWTGGVVIDIVALEIAGTRAADVRDGDSRLIIRGDYRHVEIHKAVA